MRKVSLLLGMFFAVAALLATVGCGGGGSTGGARGPAGDTTTGQTTENAAAAKSDKDGGQADTGPTSENKAGSEARIRSEIQKIVDAKLPEFGLTRDQIACVDENIATMTSQEMSTRAARPSSAGTAEVQGETVVSYLGPLADGCL